MSPQRTQENTEKGEIEKDLTEAILAAAIEVHKALGPGLLESAYETCLARELSLRGLAFTREQPLALLYKDVRMECGYRLDFVVENRVLIELKSVDGLLPIHEAQILTYLKLSGLKVGLLINFNVPRLVDGVRRLVY